MSETTPEEAPGSAALERVRAEADQIEESGTFPEDLIRQLTADPALAGPSVEGGGRLVHAEFVAYLDVLRKLSGASGAVAATLAAHTMLGVLPLRLFGSEEAKARWLGRLTTGGLAAFALTEPQGGSDIGGLETSAVRDGNDYILTGEKALIASIHHADLIIVAARTRPEGGSMGLSVFLVDPELPGVHVHDRREATMGMRGTDIGSVSFSEVRLPSTAILGRENLGMMVLHKGLVGDRVATATIALGIAEAAQAHAVRYAKSRMQGGEPISRHQAVRNLIADMEVKIAASRLLIEAAAETISAGKDATEAASVAKLHASEAANAVAKDAVQIFGGWGYLRNYPVERLMRDAKHTEIVDGTSQIQRLLIADSVLRRIR